MLADRTEVTLALAGNTHVCGVDYDYRVDSAWLLNKADFLLLYDRLSIELPCCTTVKPTSSSLISFFR